MKRFPNPFAAFTFLQRRKEGYRVFVNTPGGREVLADLAEFCRAHNTTYDADPRLHARLEGRRDVWLRVEQHLNLPAEDLYRLATGGASYVPPERGLIRERDPDDDL